MRVRLRPSVVLATTVLFVVPVFGQEQEETVCSLDTSRMCAPTALPKSC